MIHLFYFQNCLGRWIRPNIFELEEKVYRLAEDNKFIISISGDTAERFVPEKKEDIDKKIKELKDASTSDSKNLYAIYLSRNADIGEAEMVWKSLLKENPYNKIAILNLSRLYYLVEDTEAIQFFLDKLFEKTPPKKDFIFSILSTLKKEERPDENVIFLDSLSVFQEYEIKALEEIGDYYFTIGELAKAKSYYERILATYAFHPAALTALVKISSYQEKWEEAILYGKTAQKVGVKSEYHSFLLQAYYESRNYEQALKFIKETPESARGNFLFIRCWRDTLLSSNPNNDTSIILPYLKRLNDRDSLLKNDLVFPMSPVGKAMLSSITKGY